MKYSDLIDECIKIRESWNQITSTLDAHAEQFLKKIKDDNERVFIKQIFYGTYRYEEFIRTFNEALFKANTASTNRNDSSLYAVFVYLSVFRLDELPFEEFKKLVTSRDAVKLNVMFQFLFDVNMLRTHVRDNWIKLYDPDFIDGVVIKGIEDHLPLIADLLATVSKKATGKVSELISSVNKDLADSKEQKKKFVPTNPEPFQLSKPKIKALPQPMMIPKFVKSNPVPEFLNKKSLKEIEDEKKRSREERKEKLKKEYFEEGGMQTFDFETEKRPMNMESLKAEFEQIQKQKLEYTKHYREPPKFDHSEIEIKLNTAAILKDEAIMKRLQGREEEYLKNIELNMRDSTEFQRWKKEQEAKEKAALIEHQEKKRVEMQLAREAAMRAVEEKNEVNRKNVKVMKEESKEYTKEREEKMKTVFEHNKKLRSDVMATKGSAEVEKKKVIEKNKQLHDQVEKEKKDYIEKKKEEEKVIQKKREELIKKIREFEKVPIQRTKAFDPTETMGIGLLEEMSLVELRERLAVQKKMFKEAADKKRVENLTQKEEKQHSLKEKLLAIKALREETAQIHKEKRLEKLQTIKEEEKIKKEVRERSLLETHEKIMTKKQDKQDELDRIAKELREIQLKRQYLNANKAMVEEKAWKSLQTGAERQIKNKQNDTLLEQEKIESVKFNERTILASRAKTLVESKVQDLQEYDRRLEIANKENEVLFREERGEKERQVREIREYEMEHHRRLEERDPYKTKIATMSLTQAKSKELSRSMAKNQGEKTSTKNITLPPARYGQDTIHERPGEEELAH